MTTENDLGDGFLRVLETGITEQIKADSDLSESQIGAKGEIKPLYSSRRGYCECCPTWTDEKPKDNGDDPELKKRLEKARGQYAILKRLQRHGDGEWNTHSIVINSRYIRERLLDVFMDYPNVDLHAVELVFRPPFLPFIHRWEQLLQVRDSESVVAENPVRDHLNLLIDLLGTDTKQSVKTLENIHRTGFATFDSLDLVYMCGEIVLNMNPRRPLSAGILRDVEKICRGQMWAFEVDVVDWDGEKFGVSKETWTIGIYKGSRALTELAVVPLRVHPNPKGVRELLIARGRRFESLKGQHFQQYGKTAAASDSNDPRLSSLSSSNLLTDHVLTTERVIVDARAFYALQKLPSPSLRPLKELDKTLRQEHRHHHHYRGHSVPDVQPNFIRSSEPYVAKLNSKESLETIVADLAGEHPQPNGNKVEATSDHEEPAGLSDQACLLSVAYVRGFKIEPKTWASLEVSKLAEVEWNDRALDNLVLGRAEKKLITALLSSKQRQGHQMFDDFIQGKGKGVIALLGGPPGVGKTLTAETVAEHLHRPLYRLGASDLGSSTESVEARLSEALVRCGVWNALLLIDEADVFLECRTTGNLKRNELVSIFLRLLEYYSGILFLTTNRVGTLDPAFESRIDMAFHYPALDIAGRVTVLRNLLATLPADSVEPLSDDEVAELMREPLNGRHIKSAVKTAYILANSDGSRVNKEHLNEVLEIRKKTRAFMRSDDCL